MEQKTKERIEKLSLLLGIKTDSFVNKAITSYLDRLGKAFLEEKNRVKYDYAPLFTPAERVWKDALRSLMDAKPQGKMETSLAYEELEKIGCSREKADELIEKLKRAGEVYEPRYGLLASI